MAQAVDHALSWAEDDEKARRLIKEGYSWQLPVRLFLQLHGFSVRMPKLSVRDHFSQIADYAQSLDLLVDEELRVECKAREIKRGGKVVPFTSRLDYPYPTAFVDDRAKFDRYEHRPVAYVIVCKATGAMLCVDASHKAAEKWIVLRGYDRDRQREYDWYAVPSDQLLTMDWLLERLSAHRAKRGLPGAKPAQ